MTALPATALPLLEVPELPVVSSAFTTSGIVIHLFGAGVGTLPSPGPPFSLKILLLLLPGSPALPQPVPVVRWCYKVQVKPSFPAPGSRSLSRFILMSVPRSLSVHTPSSISVSFSVSALCPFPPEVLISVPPVVSSHILLIFMVSASISVMMPVLFSVQRFVPFFRKLYWRWSSWSLLPPHRSLCVLPTQVPGSAGLCGLVLWMPVPVLASVGQQVLWIRICMPATASFWHQVLLWISGVTTGSCRVQFWVPGSFGLG